MKTKMLKILALVLAMIMILGTLSSCDSRTIGPAGAQGEKGEKGDQGEQGPQGEQGKQGLSGITPQLKVGEDNYWYVSYDNGITWANLNVKATGADGAQGEQGIQGEKGDKGDKGDDGLTPTIEISDDGYWVINGKKTDVKAKGEDGSNISSTLPKYKVLFNTNSESVVKTQEVEFGNKVTEPPVPTKEGYTFDNWYVEDEKWSFIGYSVTEDITLTAKWIPINYTISYFNLASNEYPNFNGTTTQTYTIEDEVELYIPTQNGAYSFCGWYLDETLTRQITEIPKGSFGDIDLYAKWENVGIEIENQSDLSYMYKCLFNTNENRFEYRFLFEITDSHYDYIDVTFEFLSEDGVKYSMEEFINYNINFGTQNNYFYITIPYDIKGTLKIITVNVECNCLPLIPWD